MSTGRVAATPVEAQFIERWSPRAFSSQSVTDTQLAALFEAARWAPSASNEQPWMFIYANTEDNLAGFRSLLNESNQRWANQAPVLLFIFTRLNSTKTQKLNPTAKFDTGAAWMSLALQARAMGLIAHAMAGIIHEKVYETLGVNKNDYEINCAVAVGYQGSAAELPEDLREREAPSTRKAVSEFAFRGRLS